ncbi:MAG: group II truncated hemoglobin [Myxococcota bacterium]
MSDTPSPATISAFDLLGGLQGVRALVDRFYDAMDQSPDAAGIRAMHPPDLAESRDRLWMFLVGRFGGPPLYVQARGHPRLRARHLPFRIGEPEAAQWMMCMERALEASDLPGPARDELLAFFAQVASHMRNR